jgi:2-polyprenyl-3-methyl-5-hydroxy-6-metoxy-1,4-benzoquinol methylase
MILLLQALLRRLNSVKGTSEADDFSWFDPSEDPHNAASWDRYWDDQLTHGLGPPLHDICFDDRRLIRTMVEEDMSTILCAGNGISMEPRALAAAGFHVVALDFSARALEIAATYPPSNEMLFRFLDPDLLRSGGSVEFTVGNIFDSQVCQGPFDVIIERLTSQIFAKKDRDVFLGSLASRLAPEGIFLSHSHDAAWRPGRDIRQPAKEWFQSDGWRYGTESRNQSLGDAVLGW